MNNNDISKVSCSVLDVSKFYSLVQNNPVKDDRVTLVNNAQRQDVATEYIKLLMQINILKNVAEEYPGKTIENIIVQMEARIAYGRILANKRRRWNTYAMESQTEERQEKRILE